MKAAFLFHGLGSHSCTLWLIQYWIKHKFDVVQCIDYPVDELEFDEMVEYVSNEMLKYANKDDDIYLIGQSMGGVVANNIYTKGWNIKLAIYIGAPLKGAKLLTQLENVLPTSVRNAMYKKSYDVLRNKKLEDEPPHPYKTISMGWFCSKFDGCVYKNETILDETHHIHLPMSDHRTIFANPRLCRLVDSLIE